ncbi:MAG: hypothetical protein SFZ23_01830 [Planctomycetota bacterium]|nr:hypothetical protein [Planctomycetota bacterium]
MTADVRTGRQVFGDDLNLVGPFGPGYIIDSAGFSLANYSRTGSISALVARFRWIDRDTQTQVGQLDLNLQLVPIGPGQRDRVRGDIGTLRFLNIPVRPRMYYTTEFLSVTGIDIADIGISYGGPIGVGSSSRFIRNFTTGQDIDLGSENQNLGYLIRTYPLPAPGSVLVLPSLALFASRRRR